MHTREDIEIRGVEARGSPPGRKTSSSHCPTRGLSDRGEAAKEIGKCRHGNCWKYFLDLFILVPDANT